MPYKRVHRKVRIWWLRWIAIQHVHMWPPQTSFGGRVEWLRPLLDLYLPLGFTVAVGNHPALTDPRTKHQHRCRGFFIGNYPEDAVL